MVKIFCHSPMHVCILVAGFKEDAETLMSSYGYGPEFLRLNSEALEAYSACRDAAEVTIIQ